MQAITAIVRPHFEHDCWCGPGSCECCGGPTHHDVELLPDEHYRMAVFSDQRIQIPV